MAGPVLEGGGLRIAQGRIVEVLARPPRPVDVDLADAVVLPGLVNAHTHLELSHLAAPVGHPGQRLPDWIPEVVASRRATADPAAAVAAGLAESLQAGVTALGEIQQPGASAEPYAASPQTAVLFCELLGYRRETVERLCRLASEHLRRPVGPVGFSSRRLRRGLSPHAPYSVHPQVVERAVAQCHPAAPVAMHLAESPEEIEFLRSQTGPFRELLERFGVFEGGVVLPGARPLDYLRILARAPRALVIHGNCLEGDEIEFLAQHADRMAVVYCPRTHAYFRHSSYPLANMLSAGARVALGTDSRASSPSLGLWDDVLAAAGRHAGVRPRDIIGAATQEAAAALGLTAEVGSLEVGKRADLVVLDGVPTGGDDTYANIVDSAAYVAACVCGGMPAWDPRGLMSGAHIDEPER